MSSPQTNINSSAWTVAALNIVKQPSLIAKCSVSKEFARKMKKIKRICRLRKHFLKHRYDEQLLIFEIRALDTCREVYLQLKQNKDKFARTPLVVTYHPIVPYLRSTTTCLGTARKVLPTPTTNHLLTPEDFEGLPGSGGPDIHPTRAARQLSM